MKIPSLTEIDAEECRRGFYFFVKSAWHVVQPDITFVDGWHIQAICDYLQALAEGRIPSNKLLINVPPRHMKSLLCNVFFPAWVWTREPSKQFLMFSYSITLTIRDSMACRRLIGSRWYQERFHVEVDPRNDTKEQFDLLAGGHRYVFGTGSAISGQSGDYLVIDDPLDARASNSQAERDAVNLVYDTSISMRGNDPKTVRTVLIMQRLHEEDLTGHILSKSNEWEQLILPAEYDGERFHSSIGFVDPRDETGELLWPERFGPTELDEIKVNLSAMGVAGQLQQRPAPLLGAIFKREWAETRYSSLPAVARYFSWDTAASMEDTAAYTCGIVGELTPDYRLFIREVWRDRIEFPQLQYQIEAQAKKFGVKIPRAVIIENKSSGIQAIQSLKQTSKEIGPLLVAWSPKGDKVARAYEGAKWMEKGMIILPQPSDSVPWLASFEDEVFNFPNTKYKDQVDALSQLADYCSYYLQEGLRARHNRRLS